MSEGRAVNEVVLVIGSLTTLRPRFLEAWRLASEALKAGLTLELVLRERKTKRTSEQNKKLIGKRLEVLVEGVSPESEHLLVGRHAGQAPDIDGQVFINDGMAYPGELVTVEVTEAHDYDLVAKVVERPNQKQKKHAARESVPAAVRGGEKIISPPTWLAPR